MASERERIARLLQTANAEALFYAMADAVLAASMEAQSIEVLWRCADGHEGNVVGVVETQSYCAGCLMDAFISCRAQFAIAKTRLAQCIADGQRMSGQLAVAEARIDEREAICAALYALWDQPMTDQSAALFAIHFERARATLLAPPAEGAPDPGGGER